MATATFVPIATTTLGSASSPISFTSIPNTYSDLRIVIVGTETVAANNIYVQFNSDTTSTYSWTELLGDGSTASSLSSGGSSTYIVASYGGWDSTTPNMATLDIFNYAGSTFKSVLIIGSQDKNGSGNTEAIVGQWRSTSAITTINLVTSGSTTFKTGTTATLYGIKAA